ncbi:hypothetical protein ABZR86_02370 [Dyella marensis]|uniref:Uncharacterized protein n=1 Tax=Dyella marensis TaxID=500610 RepID=A0A1I2A5E2_9GAMM|nr:MULTISPECIES: hypothetical protein [Dyella]SFE37980.1 hypothetical protein SAMN02799615_00897 [Dyella marensis]
MRIRHFALLLLWVVFLGFSGPWLISAPSTAAVLIGLMQAVVLLWLTHRWLFKPTSKDPA